MRVGGVARPEFGSSAPGVVVCGCDHACPIITGEWYDTIGDTTIVNVGQTTSGPLRYAFIEADFASETPGMPDSLRVTCYPQCEVLQVR